MIEVLAASAVGAGLVACHLRGARIWPASQPARRVLVDGEPLWTVTDLVVLGEPEPLLALPPAPAPAAAPVAVPVLGGAR
jgi:hypothetical protein